MYKVYADDELIYSPDLVDDGYLITSSTLTKEENKSGTFQFNIYSNNPYYNSLHALKTRILVKDGDEEIWRGRILSIDRDFDNRKTVSCEGVLSFFVDSIIRPYEEKTCNMETQFRYYIEQHNSQMEDYKKFTIKEITVEDPYGAKKWENSSYVKTKDVIDEILDDYGGYIVIGYENGQNTISYLKDPGKRTNQVINFGENLLDITESINPENVFTVLIPIGYNANGDKITIESVNGGKDYLESEEGISKYGKVFYEHTFDVDISTAQELKDKGQEFLDKNIKASHTISIKAVDLHKIDPTIERIDVYYVIEVKSEPHNINEYEMCSKVTINLDSPESSEYVIGTIPEGITSIIAEQNSNK